MKRALIIFLSGVLVGSAGVLLWNVMSTDDEFTVNGDLNNGLYYNSATPTRDMSDILDGGTVIDMTTFTESEEPVPEPATKVSSEPTPKAFSTEPKTPRTGVLEAYVTGYTPESSCKLPGANNPNCLMASGKKVYVGAVACPNWLSFGTRVWINSTMYVCEDRYASYLDSQRGAPTFDIFTYDAPHPKQLKTVTILEN